jgi:hypothetical protein
MVEVYGYSIATVPAVAAAVYGIIEFLKYFVFTDNEKFRKYIPVIASLIGGAISVVTYLVSPDLVPVGSWFSALTMGLASGLSAVGVNQIKKQIGGDSNGS